MEWTTGIFVTLVAIVGAGLLYVRVVEPIMSDLYRSRFMSSVVDVVHAARLSARLSASQRAQTLPDRLPSDAPDRSMSSASDPSDRVMSSASDPSDRVMSSASERQTELCQPRLTPQTVPDRVMSSPSGASDAPDAAQTAPTTDRPARQKASEETVRLLRQAGVTREQAREILRSVGLSLDNNLWRSVADDKPTALTPIAQRPYDPSLYREQ